MVTYRGEDESQGLKAKGPVGSIMDDTIILCIFVIYTVDVCLDKVAFVQAVLTCWILG